MGVPYDASDLNLYKIRPYEYMEFLPSEEDSYEHLVPTVRHSSYLPFPTMLMILFLSVGHQNWKAI